LPSLTVIVLNYRKPDVTVRCLDSLAAVSYPAPLDVLVLDNGSGDDSLAILSMFAAEGRLPMRLLSSPANLGFAGGVNRVWPEARGEFVCLLNNDATVHADCLARLAGTLGSRPDLGAVWPHDAPGEGSVGQRAPMPEELANRRNGTMGILGANIWLPLLRDYRECFVASGVCVMVRRSDHQLPFLDDYFAYFEDVYLGWSLRLRGLGSERVLEAVVYHSGMETSRQDPVLSAALAFHAEKNRLANVFLLHEGRTLRRLFPLFVLDEVRRVLVAIARSLTGSSADRAIVTYARGRLWLAWNWRWLLDRRRRIQAERSAPDREILPLVSGRLTYAPGRAARAVNAVSLWYCRIAGLPVLEMRTPLATGADGSSSE